MSLPGANPDPFDSDITMTNSSMSSGSGVSVSKTSASTNQEFVPKNLQVEGPQSTSSSANGPIIPNSVLETTDSKDVQPKATNASSVGNVSSEFQGGPTHSNSVSGTVKAAPANAPSAFSVHPNAKKGLGGVFSALGNIVSPSVDMSQLQSMNAPDEIKDSYKLAREWVDDCSISIPFEDLGIPDVTVASFFVEDKKTGKFIPNRTKQLSVARSVMQKMLPNFAVDQLTSDSHIQRRNNKQPELFVLYFVNAQVCNTVNDQIQIRTNKRYPYHKPLMLSVECKDFEGWGPDEIGPQLKGQLEYYGLRGVTCHGVVKCRKALQFTVPAHLIGQLHNLSTPGYPTQVTKWDKLEQRSAAKMWCRWCFSFGHTQERCESKDDQRCDSCKLFCDRGKCIDYDAGMKWERCQSPQCPEVDYNKRTHRTSQCPSVMSNRIPINSSREFRTGSQAKANRCRFGLYPGVTVPSGSGGQSYASAAALSQPSHSPIQPSPPSQHVVQPQAWNALPDLLAGRMGKLESKYQELSNEMIRENKMLWACVQRLENKIAEQDATILKLSVRGGEVKVQRKRKNESQRSRSVSPRPTSSSSSALLRRSYSPISNQEMSDVDSDRDQPAAPSSTTGHDFMKPKAQPTNTSSPKRTNPSPFKDQRPRAELAVDKVKVVVRGIIEKLNNKKLTNSTRSELDSVVMSAINLFNSKKTKSHDQTETKLRALLLKQLTSDQFCGLDALQAVNHKSLQSVLDKAKDQFLSLFNLHD